jgi:thiamine pyrophosphokinase
LGDRLDHIFGAILLLNKYNNINIVFMEEFLEISKVSKVSKFFKKNVEIGETWSIISLSEKTEGIYLKGFKYPLNNDILYFNNPIGISNETISKHIEISYSNGSLIYFRWLKNIGG